MNSLEHIFPQNPLTSLKEDELTSEPCQFFDRYTTLSCARNITGKNQTSLDKDLDAESQRQDWIDLVEEYEKAVEEYKKAIEENEKAAEDKKINDFYVKFSKPGESRDQLRGKLHNFYCKLTDAHKKLFGQEYKYTKEYSYLDSIGNVVLLLAGENTTVSNFNFAKKRSLIRKMINSGKPIPAHTFDAFSKIGGDMNHTECWQLSDVVNNANFTLGQVFLLRKALEAAASSLTENTVQPKG